MGTEVHYKNLFPGYHSMRNVNEDSTNSSWHLFNALTSSHYYDGFTPRNGADTYSGHDKDELKQKILQHEAVFKNQVYELHRLYRRQRDIMEEVKRNEFNKYPISIDMSSSSSLMASQKPFEDANRWHNPSFPLGNSNTTSRPSIFGAEISNYPSSSTAKGSKDCEVVECRPSKVRKKLFDLRLPGHQYIDPEDGEHVVDNRNSEILSNSAKDNGFANRNGVITFLDDGGKKDGYTNTTFGQQSMRSNGLADLNEPYGQDASDISERFRNLPFESKSNGRDGFSACLREPGNFGGNMNHTSLYIETNKLRTPPDTMQHLYNKEFQHRGFYSEVSSKIQDDSRYNQTPLLFNASGANSYADSMTHMLTSFKKCIPFTSSPKSHQVFRDKWHKNSNGFYNGSSSGSNQLPARLHSAGFGYRNGNKFDDGSQKILKGSNFVDLTGTVNVMDLNIVQNLSNEDGNSRKCDQQSVLPWLRAKPDIHKNTDHSGDLAKERDDSLGTNKKTGFPIFGNFCVLKNDDSAAGSTSASTKHRGFDINVAWDAGLETQIDAKPDAENENVKNLFDLNSCVTEEDDLLVMETVKSSKTTKTDIDLEVPAVSDIVEGYEHKETEQENNHLENTKLEKIAAEAIIAIASQQNHTEFVSKETSDNDNDNNDDCLLWFAELIDSCETNVVSAEIDEYEMLTLQLEETKKEAYMPMPLVLDFQEPDEVGPTSTSSRPRRGQARRGRPRRDFQRDVLPGITSLARQEITEDLQIFGGLMRATGHSWTLGSPRKNKRLGVQGKRKVKAAETTVSATASPSPPKQLKTVELAGLDERSLTGWGKTTRRPRRQRCAAGNSVAVPLT